MEALYNITPVLVNILGKIQLKNFPISTFADCRKAKTRKNLWQSRKAALRFPPNHKNRKAGEEKPQKLVQHRFKWQINGPKRIFLQRETDFFYFSGKKPWLFLAKWLKWFTDYGCPSRTDIPESWMRSKAKIVFLRYCFRPERKGHRLWAFFRSDRYPNFPRELHCWRVQ